MLYAIWQLLCFLWRLGIASSTWLICVLAIALVNWKWANRIGVQELKDTWRFVVYNEKSGMFIGAPA